MLAALDQAGALAVGRTIIHPSVAKRLVEAVNTTAGEIHSFHKVLSISEKHRELEPLPWLEAWKDFDQLKEAAKDGVVVGCTIAAGGSIMLARFAPKPGAPEKSIDAPKTLK